MRPIATCSPRNFALVKSYGAEEVFNYHSPTCAADIKAYTKNALKYVLDCISEPETMQLCYQCIGRLGGRYTALEPYVDSLHTRPNVKPDWTLAAWGSGRAIGWKAPFGRGENPELADSSVKYFETVQMLLNQGKIRAHPIQRMDGGLPGVLEGLEQLRRKQISGKKLVYRVS
jgi:NADPH:quinone reductase-like Zn-dependent oxidoreductase